MERLLTSIAMTSVLIVIHPPAPPTPASPIVAAATIAAQSESIVPGCRSSAVKTLGC